jgi:peptide/nickel transport system permease protein
MSRFIARRLVSMIVVLFALSVLVFAIFFAIPGIDPARRLAGRNATPETLATVRRAFGLDRPLPVQYWHMMDQLFVSRTLQSYVNRGVRVVPELLAAAPVTLSLVLGATIIWLAFSILLGVVAAVLRQTVWDQALMVACLVAVSVPVFWLGQVANLVSQDRWHATPLTQNPLSWFQHLVIPWIVLAAGYVGLYARVLRSALLEVRSEDFIRTARSKGISERRVIVRHMLRTSMSSYTSLFGLDFSALVGGGALLVEVVFGLPGIGLLTYQSLAGLDLPVIMATVLYGGAFIVVVNACVDVFYARLDPRVRRA